MVETTAAATQEIESDSRRWNLILTDQREHKLESADGNVISMSHTIEPSTDEFTIGEIFTQNINIELRRAIDQDTSIVFDYDQNSAIEIAYGLRDAPGLIHMGTFRVKTVEKVRDRIRLNLKDYFINELSDTYTASSSLTYPAPILDVMQDICSEYLPMHLYEPLLILDDEHEGEYMQAYDRAGSPLYVRSNSPTDEDGNPIELSQTEVQYLSGKKVSDALRICAGILGVSLVKGRDNSLTCVRPSKVPLTITSSRAADPDFSGKEQMIIGVLCHRNDDVYAEDTFESWLTDEHLEPLAEGIFIEFENPLMKNTDDNMWFSAATSGYEGWYMRPATVEHMLGDPRLDPLDIVKYEDLYEDDYEQSGTFQLPIMSMSYTFDGGLSCTLRATAKYKYT